MILPGGVWQDFFFKEILLVYSTKAAWAYRVELARLVAIPETSG